MCSTFFFSENFPPTLAFPSTVVTSTFFTIRFLFLRRSALNTMQPRDLKFGFLFFFLSVHFPFFLARPSAGTRHSHKLFSFLKKEKGSPSPLSICEKRVVRLQWSHKEGGRRGLFITEAKSGEMRPLYPQEKGGREKHSCIFATGKTVWETQLLFFFPFFRVCPPRCRNQGLFLFLSFLFLRV